jgi:ADP-ribosylglycohydrolase
MKNNSRTMVMATFVADAISLGVHWVYNAHVIERKFGRIETYVDSLTSYHKGKKKGDLTHIGDQSFVLLESLAENPKFDLKDFTHRWQASLENYAWYVDKATQATLENLKNGQGPEKSGSDSDELSGACRIAPIIYALHEDEDALVAAVKAQTVMSHNNPLTGEAAEFLARVTAETLQGNSPVSTLKAVAEKMQLSGQMQEWLEKGIESASGGTFEAVAEFGQACAMKYAFPGAIHLIVKYENDYKEAMVENIMAGGDSAARGMAAGMVLGAWKGEDTIPDIWLKGLIARPRIESLMDQIDAGKS